MATIITTTVKSVIIQSPEVHWNVVKSRIKGQIPFPEGVTLVTEMGTVNLFYEDTTGDGNTFASALELQNYIETNCFSSGGTGPGTGVQSVQPGPGISVNNEDPYNPIVSTNAAAPKWDDIDEMPQFIASGNTAASARAAIGLGSASTRPATDFDPSGSAAAAEASAKSYTDSKTSSIYRIRSAVATVADLPATGNEVGDVRDVQETGMNYVWMEEVGWDSLGKDVIVDWDSLEKPTYLAAGETAAAARDAIGAQQSLSVPSQAEAEAGTSDTPRSWTAERVKQAASAAVTIPEVPSQEEVETGTATTARTITAQRMRQGANAAIEASNKVGSAQEGGVGGIVTNIIEVTQAQYDGLTPQSSTFYIIITV